MATPGPVAYGSVHSSEWVTYVSDVEGHWDYFCSWVDLSKGVRWATAGDHRGARTSEEVELVLEDGWHCVFGGDTCDKGLGTLRFLEAVVRLKRKHPDRVHLLLGNRDINKVRWTSELADSEIERVNEVPGAYWVSDKARMSPWRYLRKLAACEQGLKEEEVTDEMIRAMNSKANRMRYMLKFDMGSDGEFDFRRIELAHMAGKAPEDVSDDEVIRSYEESLRPGGWMWEYLMHAQLAVMVNDVLFVHGQIIGNDFKKGQVQFADDDNVAWSVGVVPGLDAPIRRIRVWLEQLNTWSRTQMEGWVRQPTWATPPTVATEEDWRGRGGADLICYGTPSTRWPTVVYCRWLTPKSMPLKYPEGLQEHLKQNGVRFVVVGHTPHGTCPTVVRSGDVTCVMADTSFSHMKADLAFTGDNRGVAACDITFNTVGGATTCSVKGFTEKEQIIDYMIGAAVGDPYIGLMQDCSESGNQFYVKALLPRAPGTQQASYLMNHIDGFRYDYTLLSEEEVNDSLSGGDFPNIITRALSGSGDLFGHSFQGFDADQLLLSVFGMLDRDGDGSVTKDELLLACTDKVVRQALLTSFPEMSMESIMECFDGDRDGRITLDEFRSKFCPESVLNAMQDKGGVYFEVLPEGGLAGDSGKPFPNALPAMQLLPAQRLPPGRLVIDWGHASTWATEGRDCELSRDCVASCEWPALSGLPGASFRGYLSPMHPVNLPEEDSGLGHNFSQQVQVKLRAQIPPQSRHFAWCYPFTLEGRPVPHSDDAVDADASFLSRGGYVYFNGNMQVSGLVAAVPDHSGGLRFGPARCWRPEWTAPIRRARRWHPVADMALAKAGAMDFAWIRPLEVVGGPIREGGRPIAKFGALAYLLSGQHRIGPAVCPEAGEANPAGLADPGGLTQNEEMWVREVFQWCDANSDGQITYRELQDACQSRPDIAQHLGLSKRAPVGGPALNLDAVWQTIDSDRGGTITLDELTSYYAKHPNRRTMSAAEQESAVADFREMWAGKASS